MEISYEETAVSNEFPTRNALIGLFLGAVTLGAQTYLVMKSPAMAEMLMTGWGGIFRGLRSLGFVALPGGVRVCVVSVAGSDEPGFRAAFRGGGGIYHDYSVGCFTGLHSDIGDSIRRFYSFGFPLGGAFGQHRGGGFGVGFDSAEITVRNSKNFATGARVE